MIDAIKEIFDRGKKMRQDKTEYSGGAFFLKDRWRKVRMKAILRRLPC